MTGSVVTSCAFFYRVTLEAPWCARVPQGGSSWPVWWVGVWAVLRSTGLGFIHVSPGFATGSWATQIPAWSMNTLSTSPRGHFFWQEAALITHPYPEPRPPMRQLHHHYLVKLYWKQPSLLEVVRLIKLHHHHLVFQCQTAVETSSVAPLPVSARSTQSAMASRTAPTGLTNKTAVRLNV